MDKFRPVLPDPIGGISAPHHHKNKDGFEQWCDNMVSDVGHFFGHHIVLSSGIIAAIIICVFLLLWLLDI